MCASNDQFVFYNILSIENTVVIYIKSTGTSLNDLYAPHTVFYIYFFVYFPLIVFLMFVFSV